MLERIVSPLIMIARRKEERLRIAARNVTVEQLAYRRHTSGVPVQGETLWEFEVRTRQIDREDVVKVHGRNGQIFPPQKDYDELEALLPKERVKKEQEYEESMDNYFRKLIRGS